MYDTEAPFKTSLTQYGASVQRSSSAATASQKGLPGSRRPLGHDVDNIWILELRHEEDSTQIVPASLRIRYSARVGRRAPPATVAGAEAADRERSLTSCTNNRPDLEGASHVPKSHWMADLYNRRNWLSGRIQTSTKGGPASWRRFGASGSRRLGALDVYVGWFRSADSVTP